MGTINRDDMLELTRRMTLKRNCFDRIAGAYLDKDKKSHWYYEEPDFERYTENLSNSCKHLTRVIYDDNTTIKVGGSELPDSVLMGINTKEFGETAELKSGLNDEHWYNYLNSIATVSNGVIISSNLAKKYDLSVITGNGLGGL
mgnify:CR=1 FL=1